MTKGTQVIYLPPIAGNNVNHPARRTGFIDRVENGRAFCWFWYKDEQNRTFHKVDQDEPKNVSLDAVHFLMTTEQKYVDHWVTKIEKRDDK